MAGAGVQVDKSGRRPVKLEEVPVDQERREGEAWALVKYQAPPSFPFGIPANPEAEKGEEQAGAGDGEPRAEEGGKKRRKQKGHCKCGAPTPDGEAKRLHVEQTLLGRVECKSPSFWVCFVCRQPESKVTTIKSHSEKQGCPGSRRLRRADMGNLPRKRGREEAGLSEGDRELKRRLQECTNFSVYRTGMCSLFGRPSGCAKGDECTFAHSQGELRTREENNRDCRRFNLAPAAAAGGNARPKMSDRRLKYWLSAARQPLLYKVGGKTHSSREQEGLHASGDRSLPGGGWEEVL